MALRVPLYGLRADFTGPTGGTAQDPVTFTDLTNGADKWQWDFGDGSGSTAQNPTHAYPQTGATATYTVELTASKNNVIAGIVRKENFIEIVPIPLDPDAEAFLIATNLLSDSTISTAIDALVIDLKNASLWSKFDALYPFVGGTASTHKYNLKDPRDLDAAFRLEFAGSAAAVHTSDGVQFPDQAYAKTFCAPGGGNLDRCYGEYIRSVEADGWSGVFIGSVFGFKVNTSPAVSAYGLNNLTGSNVAISYGTLTVSIIDASTAKMFNNQTEVASATPNDGPAPDAAFGGVFLGAMNLDNTGVWGEFAKRTISFAHLGDGLVEAEHDSLATIIQDFQIALNREV
jgi:PKD repeat protein